MLDSELFLPEGWSEDRERCEAAAIPADMTHRTKPRIAIELVKRALANGVGFDFLTYDEGYGRDPQFLLDLDELGQVAVGEVPSNFHCLASLPKGGREGRGPGRAGGARRHPLVQAVRVPEVAAVRGRAGDAAGRSSGT